MTRIEMSDQISKVSLSDALEDAKQSRPDQSNAADAGSSQPAADAKVASPNLPASSVQAPSSPTTTASSPATPASTPTTPAAAVGEDYKKEESPKKAEPKKAEKWKKFGDIQMDEDDRKIIADFTDWLTDTQINAAQSMLEKQFPAMGGLQNVLLINLNQLQKLSEDKPKFVQIMQEGANHWVCASNVFSTEPNEVIVYDSRCILKSGKECVEKEILSAISQLVPDLEVITYKECSQQQDTNQCGVFSIAFAVALCNNIDPSTVVISSDARIIRPHLIRCFDEEELVPFPNGETIETYYAEGAGVGGYPFENGQDEGSEKNKDSLWK